MRIVATGYEPSRIQKVRQSPESPIPPSLLLWSWGERKTRWLCAILCSISVAYMTLGALFVAHQARHGGRSFCGDFFALWSYGRIAIGHQATMLYDFWALHAAQVGLGMPPRNQWPFPYPPFFLALLMPLGAMPMGIALIVWEATTISLYLIATCSGHRHPLPWIAAFIVPTTTIGMMAGQSGFLAASLMIGGFRLLARRPILAGILFGLLSYKPQLGFLVPVALLAAREWRAVASAAATVSVLVISTREALGPTIWPTFLHALPVYERWFESVSYAEPACPTVMASLQLLGMPRVVASVAQDAASIVSAILVWKALRGGTRHSVVPIVPVLTVLGTPHAFAYDLPMLASAVVLFLRERVRLSRAFRSYEIVVLVLVVSFPAIMTWQSVIAPIGPPVLAAFTFLILSASRRQSTDVAPSTIVRP